MGIKDRDLINDISQNCFIALWNNRMRLKEDSNLRSYLFTIGYRRYLNHVKKEKRQRSFLRELLYFGQLEKIAQETEDKMEREARLWDAVHALPEKCKQILLLHKVHGLKYAEIAQELEISVKTVESQMRISFIKIRQHLTKDCISK